jgi:hypothetical protein
MVEMGTTVVTNRSIWMDDDNLGLLISYVDLVFPVIDDGGFRGRKNSSSEDH